MKRLSKSWIFAVVALVFGCSGDINRSSSPVELVVTNTQNLNLIDLLPGAPSYRDIVLQATQSRPPKRGPTGNPLPDCSIE